jgi:hypothetical protein
MRSLSEEEVLYELQHLDETNGWGVNTYRDGVAVSLNQLVCGVIKLVEQRGSYPAKKTRDSEFWFLIIKELSGTYTLGETYEASMLNYKKDFWSGEPLEKYAIRLVSSMFRVHINSIQVSSASNG